MLDTEAPGAARRRRGLRLRSRRRRLAGVDAARRGRAGRGCSTSAARPPRRGRTSARCCARRSARDGPLGLAQALGAPSAGPSATTSWRSSSGFTPLRVARAPARAARIESLQSRMLKLERQNALAHLARGVAHDINNALGQVLPLVQQIRADLKDDRLDPVRAGRRPRAHRARRSRSRQRDLRAHDAFRPRLDQEPRPGRRRPRLRHGARRDARQPQRAGGSRCTTASTRPAGGPLRAERPRAVAAQPHEQRPRRDAATAARCEVAARGASHHVELVIADQGRRHDPRDAVARSSGRSSPPSEHGTGLGLSTCRSIVAEAGGELAIESEPGVGTRVTAHLPPAPLEAAGDE